MNRLKKQIQWLIFILLGSISSLSIFYGIFILNYNEKAQTLQAQITNYHTVIDYFNQNTHALEHYQQSVDSLTHIKDSLVTRIATEDQLPQVLEQTARLFQRQGVQVLAATPDVNRPAPIQTNGYSQLPLNWKIKGNFLAIAATLEQLERLPIQQWPVTWQFQRDLKTPGKVLVEFQSRIWLKRKSNNE